MLLIKIPESYYGTLGGKNDALSKPANHRIEGARCAMRMIINSRRGFAARLCICLGLVLLLSFIASVASAGDTSKGKLCAEICKPCVKDPDTEQCKRDLKCLPICRILYQEKNRLVYGWFEQECCTYKTVASCQPQKRCKNNGRCQISGDPHDETCKGKVTSCSEWRLIPGSLSYGTCSPRPT